MLTPEENDRLTRVEPGTPMGNLLRRYWHPVGTTAELDQEPVQGVRLLGEDLVLFRMANAEFGMRNESGPAGPQSALRTPQSAIRYGLIGRRCPQRGVSLEYGIPQANGLRCCYHGWTMDTRGRVVDMPFEPAVLPLRIASYPVQELGGLVFAYLGPEPVPLLPRWDVLVREDLNKSIRITPLPCSWLQCMDNSLDPIHFEHLHGVYGNYVMKKLGRPPMLSPQPHLKIEFDVFEYGIYKRRLVQRQPDDDTNTDWRVGHPILFPHILAQGGPDQMSMQYRIPTDDANTLHIVIQASRPRDGQPLRKEVAVSREPLTYDEWGRIIAPYIVRQDEAAWVGQGPITDRTTEHLATSDKGSCSFGSFFWRTSRKCSEGKIPWA